MALTIYPWIIATDYEKQQKKLMQHENIHLQQQKELLIIPFFILYVLNFIFNIFRYWNVDKAYKLICFEVEAKTYEKFIDKRHRFRMFKQTEAMKIYKTMIKKEKNIFANVFGAIALATGFIFAISLIILLLI